MPEQSQITLRAWTGSTSWGTPSIDPECLCIITYAKFTKAPLVVEESIPAQTVTEMLPELQIEESVYTNMLNILGILRREGYNADFNLNSIDHGDTLAYIALIEGKLRPGLMNSLWVDAGNYVNCTRPAYCKGFGFFRSYWDLPKMRNKVEVDLLCRGVGTAAEMEAAFYKDAKSCITILSKRLDTNDYFFGSTPTTLDAVVFAYLSILLKAPVSSTQLKNHLLACDNLCKFCARISQRYFKDADAGLVYGKPEAPESKGTSSERRKQIVSISVALTAMVVYGLVMGIFRRGGGRAGRPALIETDELVD